MEPVALAMKSIAPLSLATIGARGERLVDDRAGRGRRDREVGRATRVRAADVHVDLACASSFVATQLKKKAAQSAFFALAAMP